MCQSVHRLNYRIAVRIFFLVSALKFRQHSCLLCDDSSRAPVHMIPFPVDSVPGRAGVGAAVTDAGPRLSVPSLNPPAGLINVSLRVRPEASFTKEPVTFGLMSHGQVGSHPGDGGRGPGPPPSSSPLCLPFLYPATPRRVT